VTRRRHRPLPNTGRRVRVVLGLVSGAVCLAALFALLQLGLALENAHAYSVTGATAGEMTVTYAGLEAPTVRSHPGMRAPARLCDVVLEDGTGRYLARVDGAACDTLQAGNKASVLTWRGNVIAVEGWATASEPQAEVVAWVVATAVLGFAAVILTAASVRASGNRRPSWYYDRLEG
jgi:hypothetical protein